MQIFLIIMVAFLLFQIVFQTIFWAKRVQIIEEEVRKLYEEITNKTEILDKELADLIHELGFIINVRFSKDDSFIGKEDRERIGRFCYGLSSDYQNQPARNKDIVEIKSILKEAGIVIRPPKNIEVPDPRGYSIKKVK